MTIFNDRLRQCRKDKNLSQEYLADLLGVIPRSYRKYEGTDREPKITGLIALAHCFEVSIDYLVGRTDISRKPEKVNSRTQAFSERLRTLRKLKGVRQKDVADKLGMRERSFGLYEYGRRQPRIAGLIALADYFGVTVDCLVGVEDIPK